MTPAIDVGQYPTYALNSVPELNSSNCSLFTLKCLPDISSLGLGFPKDSVSVSIFKETAAGKLMETWGSQSPQLERWS